MSATILVLGSLNMDFVVRTEHLPAAGQTVLGSDFRMIPGGKGANQACAAGKLAGQGTKVQMIGRVGRDVFADQLRVSLSTAGVDVSTVTATDQPSGTAFIWVDAAGQNSIVVASGANFAFPAEEVSELRGTFQGASFALFQLETPLATVEAAMQAAREEGVRTILDPAPAQPLNRELLSEVDILTPNELEACQLLGRPAERVPIERAPALVRALLELGPQAVILKLGEQGCYYGDAHQEVLSRGFVVDAVDSTAAGDVFNAALAVALSERRGIESALPFANAAAAISVTRMGAQSSIPTRAEVDAFLSA